MTISVVIKEPTHILQEGKYVPISLIALEKDNKLPDCVNNKRHKWKRLVKRK